MPNVKSFRIYQIVFAFLDTAVIPSNTVTEKLHLVSFFSSTYTRPIITDMTDSKLYNSSKIKIHKVKNLIEWNVHLGQEISFCNLLQKTEHNEN